MVKKRSVGSVLKSLFHFFVEVAFFWQLVCNIYFSP